MSYQIPQILPTMVIGSHALPSWLFAAKEAIQEGEFGPTDVRETMDDAVRIAIADMEEAGVDIISDGEMRRETFIYGFYSRLSGLERVPPPRKVGHAGYDLNESYRTAGKVGCPQGLGVVEEFRYARKICHRPLKMALPGPLTLSRPIALGQGYSKPTELAYDMAGIVNQEAKRLVAEGATHIQIDEPRFSYYSNEAEESADLFNHTIQGVDAKIGLHICFGNYRGRPSTWRRYAPIFPALMKTKAHQLCLEFANREMAEIELWKERGDDRELAVGVVDVKSHYVETSEEVAWRIREALKYVGPEKMVVTPDCGFHQTPRWVAVAKLKALVEGARLARQGLAGHSG